MYKFYGKPLQEILSKTTRKVMFRFDTKGEFITDDPEIINRAKGFFDHIELKAEIVGDKVKKTFADQPITITTKDNPVQETKQESKKLKCKKCNFETVNQGVLMRHYKEHKE
jgi:hypothetical protein